MRAYPITVSTVPPAIIGRATRILLGHGRRRRRAGVATLGTLALLTASSAVAAPTAAAATAASGTGASWRIQASPSQPNSYNFLSSVSCVTGGSCVAVGRYSTTSGDRPLTMVRTGDNWRLVATPPLSVADAQLNTVSCVSASLCMAVGFSVGQPPASNNRALVEEWDGTKWTIVPTPLPSGTRGDVEAGLIGVSCLSAAFCLAVGDYTKNVLNDQEQPLAERWDGMAWSLVRTPNPQAENGSGLTAVDCVATNQCQTVGFDAYADIDQALIAYSWNGSSWSGQHPVNPGGQDYNTGSSVSCTAASACTAVGTWTGDFLLSLAERWNASGWSRQAVPNPQGTVTDDLSGVSCTGPRACTAVGSWADNGNDFPSSPMTAQWNGTGWSLTPAAIPPGGNAALASVSCPRAGACVAVGASIGSAVPAATLVEVQ